MEPALNLLHGLMGTGSSPSVTINVKMINGINVVQYVYPQCRWLRCSWWCWYGVRGFPDDNINANLALVVSTVKIMRNGGGHSVNHCECRTKKRTENVIKDKLIVLNFCLSRFIYPFKVRCLMAAPVTKLEKQRKRKCHSNSLSEKALKLFAVKNWDALYIESWICDAFDLIHQVW